ncbi:MAG: C-terminal target protein [Chitinophagaceae bacterium]|nr:C-terminal target protein [Chitinophagaceae bacterium]
MQRNVTAILFLCLSLTGIQSAMSQLSGVINTYTKITNVDYLCNSITAASVTGFAAGDKVLLIQMQGATIDQTNTVNFGNITAMGDAGNYEFAIIDHFVGNAVYLTKTLLRTYTPSGAVQMINVPQYDAVSIDGELSAQAWDGNTGGVVVFESSSTVTMNANINVSEQGFRGGDKSTAGGDCFTSANGTYTYSYPNINAGQKGEGIAAYITGKESGRGKQANGGGGGNSHNTGGGGGGNYGAGGRGGDKKNTGCGAAPDPYGYGAIGLSSTYYTTAINKIFLGGGGGGGHQNNSLSFDAGNGGGIVIIRAAALNANGYTIRSNGGSVATYYTSVGGDNGDGNSGGGSGGTILLDIASYSSATPIEAFGGKGGNTGYTTYDFGPGGGGGGGLVWLSASPAALSPSANVNGGSSGISGSGGGNGSGTAWGAVNGSNGAVLSSLAIPQSTSSSSCALPVELLSFTAKAIGAYSVQMNWSTASEFNNDYFTLEKSTDGIHFTPVTKVNGQSNSHALTRYTYADEVQGSYELLYYGLWQTDLNGHAVNLGIRKVYPAATKVTATVYPNPCQDKLYLELSIDQKENITSTYFINTLGELINVALEQNGDLIYLNTTGLSKGLYSLLIFFKDSSQTIKVIKD